MFLRELLCICVVLHFGPGFYKCVDCALVRKPKNVAVLSGENVTLNCASSVSKGNVAWSTVDSGNYIYINKAVVPSVSSYITVSDEDDGNCSLNINVSLIAAKRYICIERDSGEEASAELIVLQNHMKCNSQVNDGSVHVNCSIVSAGTWDPVVECAQMNEDKMFIGLQGSQTRKSDNNVVTNTWNFSSKNHVYDIICSIESKHTDRPRETTAAYCPLCGFRESEKFCNTELDKEYSVQWSPTFAGEEIHRSCPGHPTGLCSRKCLLNLDGIAFWSETTYIICSDKESRDVLKHIDYTDIVKPFDKGSRDVLKKYGTPLSIISIIGCSISVVALILTVLVYALTWKQSGSAQTTFLLSLCVALIIAYIIIIIMAGLGKDDSKDGCSAVAVLLYYFLLAAFFVMLAEGIELILYEVCLIKFRGLIGTIILVASAWVLPIIVVVSLVSAKGEEYGNSFNCWLSVDSGLIWALFSSVLCIIVANFVIRNFALMWMFRKEPFLAKSEKKGDESERKGDGSEKKGDASEKKGDESKITRADSQATRADSQISIADSQITKDESEKKRDESEKERDEIRRGTLWNMSVTCPMLGLGCLFGFFSIVFSSVIFQLLFVIINSLLGVSLLIFHALYHNKVTKEKLSKYICRSRKLQLAPTEEPAKKLDKSGIESSETMH